MLTQPQACTLGSDKTPMVAKGLMLGMVLRVRMCSRGRVFGLSVSLFVCLSVCPPLFGLFARSKHYSTSRSGGKGSLGSQVNLLVFVAIRLFHQAPGLT